jgi:hypothetical protein
MVSLVCLSGIEDLEISVSIVGLDFILMMDNLSGIKFTTKFLFSFPAMDKFTGIYESEISLYISIGLASHSLNLDLLPLTASLEIIHNLLSAPF